MVEAPIRCTVHVLTRNSAATLERALESVRGFAEVVVCDGGSEDRTTDIAERFGCVILEQDPRFVGPDGFLRDYAGARNQMRDASSYEWIFQLDSDEVATPELVETIRQLCSDTSSLPGYMVAALYTVGGRRVDCASTYPMHFLRLFRASSSSPYRGAVNENVEVEGPLGRIEEPFLIPLMPVIPLVRKWARYVKIRHREVRNAPAATRARERARTRSVVRWFLRDLRRAHRGCSGFGLPARYEVARFSFYIAMFAAVRIGDLRARQLSTRDN